MRTIRMFTRRQVRALARDYTTEVTMTKKAKDKQPERYWKVESSVGQDGQRVDTLEADLRKSKITAVSMTARELDALIRAKVDEAFTRLTPEERDLLVKSAERRRTEASMTPSQRMDGLTARDAGGRPEGLLVSQRGGRVPARAGMAAPDAKRASLRSVVEQPASLRTAPSIAGEPRARR